MKKQQNIKVYSILKIIVLLHWAALPGKKFGGALPTLPGSTVYRQIQNTAKAAHAQLHCSKSFLHNAQVSANLDNLVFFLYAGKPDQIIHLNIELKTV